MRKRLLIGLALYLAVGVAFGFSTDREWYMCPSYADGHYAALPDDGITLVEVDRVCVPISSPTDRLQWVATTAPAWFPLVVRNVVRGDGVPIGSLVLAGQ